nr:unnamed protein product [Digitaria exilis]CAB3456388.1 unnamed protein product [Digitaria exilis]
MDTDSTDEDDVNDEDYIPEPEVQSKRKKRHTPAQIQELRAVFEQCNHPDEKTRRALGTKIGLEARQVRFWFQNQRSQMQAKAMVEDGKLVRQEHATLMAENVSLRHAMVAKCCSACGGGTVSAEPSPEKRRLLAENSRLKDEHMRANSILHKVLLEVTPSAGHPTTHPRLSTREGWSSRAALLRLAEASMEQFLMLATKGEPLWVPTPDGEVMSYQAYQKKTLPVHHGVCPNGFFREATREAGIVRATAADIVDILTDTNRWLEMFPSVVASVTAGDVICGGVCNTRDRLIQMMNAELWVQSPRLRNHSISFLRYSRLTSERQWAVMDVSVEGSQCSHKLDLNVDSSEVPAWNTDCRLLPSGCLLEDIGDGCCKITWIVHAEYDETTVPTMFRPLFRSGKALGAHRWLASLQRQCEVLAVLRSIHVPSNHNPYTVSSMAIRGILELAQRMMASFYSAVSGPVTQPSSNIDEWHGGAGTGAERIDVAVRMVTWKKAGTMGGEPAGLVLSASTTVWLPNTPPQRVFEYLCNDQRVKTMMEDGIFVQREHAALMAENVSLRHAILAKCCSACGGGTTPFNPSPEKLRLLAENAMLHDEHMRAINLPVPSVADGWASRASLRRHTEASMEEFIVLATGWEPLWVMTPDGEALSYQVYQRETFPVQQEACPNGFFREATREAGIVRASVTDIVNILTDANRWSEMFPGIVAGANASDVVCGDGVSTRDGLIQLMNAELWVQSPRLRNRRVSFLRYSRMTAPKQWAVMDVSVDGILFLAPQRSQAWRTDCRLLPSGCLVEDMDIGYCKVTWIVHADYDLTMVPNMFKPLFRSGKALGAHRWLASLRRQCEFLAALHSSHVPSSHSTAATVSPMGSNGILELAQRMMASFYSAVSGPVTQPSSNINEWHGDTGTGAERIDVAVRMVTWQKAGSMGGEPAGLVLSASTTVWLPNTPPQLVFEYLCNDQRRGKWDTFANGGAAVLSSIATGHLDGNAVSILRPNTLVPASPSGDYAAGAFDGVGMQLCRAIKNVKAAVTAKLVVPTALM